MTKSAEIPATGGDEQYGHIETSDGDTVIYDREAADAWVQSSVTVSVDP